MSKTVDVLVVGSGMAGLVAALAAAESGASVRLLSMGAGSLAISSGVVDLLGYVDGVPQDDPWEGMGALPAAHPYRLLGVDRVRQALDFFRRALAAHGWPMAPAGDGDAPRNTWLPTVMGTLKPSYLLPEGLDTAALAQARRVLVVSVEGLRDCRPALVVDQLRRYPAWAGREFLRVLLPSPFAGAHRSVSALDLARLADRPSSAGWLAATLAPHAGKADLVLLPPLCGCKANAAVRRAAEKAVGCPVAELLSIPPGVGGLRLRDALLAALRALRVEVVENAAARRVEGVDGVFASLVAEASGQERRHAAGALVLATGGILGGGVELTPGRARETVCGMDLDVPQDVGLWSAADIFGSHLFARLGVPVDGDMRPVDAGGRPRWRNVFVAGRTVGGYDYATEKSGHGVAIATGWQAGRLAARSVRGGVES